MLGKRHLVLVLMAVVHQITPSLQTRWSSSSGSDESSSCSCAKLLKKVGDLAVRVQDLQAQVDNLTGTTTPTTAPDGGDGGPMLSTCVCKKALLELMALIDRVDSLEEKLDNLTLTTTTSTTTPAPAPADGDVRLVGGASDNEGRVELFLNGEWGTVCDNYWSTNEAKVVCNQLGLPSGFATAHKNAFFGEGTGPILLDNLVCTGTEANLLACPSGSTNGCTHAEDAGVTCQ